MKRYYNYLLLVFMAVLVLALSGCGSDDDDTSPRTDRLMVISSTALKTGTSYNIYRGDKVSVRSITSPDGYNPLYYVAPILNAETVTINLEFEKPISRDVPFMVTAIEDDAEQVVLYYNPSGTDAPDTTTDYGNVLKWGGTSQKLMYQGLNVTGAAIDLDTSDEVVINLDYDSAAIEGGSAVPFYNYVWHADPDHRDEYFTLDGSGEELDEDTMMNDITTERGVYIARDVRYMPDTLEFTGTATKDEDTEYVAYYSDSVAQELYEELGEGFEGPYIFATLPMTNSGMPGGNGGNPGGPGDGGTPPDRPGTETPPVTASVSNEDIAAFATMTHSAEEAYNNPVLHIVEPGTYRLRGTWHGQIWLDPGENEDIAIILDGVEVSCDVAPAIVFHNVRECGPDDADNVVSFDVGNDLLGDDSSKHAGAVVVIADGTTNRFTGANVYRMLKAQKKKDSVTTINGTDISQQKKRYKMDGAFYSFVSLAIGAENDDGNGRLYITSTTYEGLDSELHLLIDSGIITVSADDDGINVNEDDTSVFTMNGGTLTVISKNGDGIDSNGYIVINNGRLDVTAVRDSNQLNAQADGPLDADLGVYMSDNVKYTHRAYSELGTDTGTDNTGTNDNTGTDTNNNNPADKPITVVDDGGSTVLTISYTTPVKDEETSNRNVKDNDEVFILRHKANSFSGVKYVTGR